MKKPRISSLPVGPRPKAGRRCRSKLISVVSCTATTLRPLHAAAVRATWGVSSAVGLTSLDDRRRCAAISPERVPPNSLTTSDPLATIRSSIHSARSSRRASPSTDLVRAIATLRESIAMKALNHVRTSDGIDLCEYRRGISRGSVYYEPSGVSQSDLALMRRIDELHLAHPHAGSRMLRDLLAAEGSKIGRRHVRTFMERMGRGGLLQAQNIGSCVWPQDLSISTAWSAYRPGEPGVGVGHNVHPYGARLRLSCCRHGLVGASHSGLATVDHAWCGLLHRGARGGFAPLW